MSSPQRRQGLYQGTGGRILVDGRESRADAAGYVEIRKPIPRKPDARSEVAADHGPQPDLTG